MILRISPTKGTLHGFCHFGHIWNEEMKKSSFSKFRVYEDLIGVTHGFLKDEMSRVKAFVHIQSGWGRVIF